MDLNQRDIVNTFPAQTWFDDYNKFADMCGIPKGNLLHWNEPNQKQVLLAKHLVIEEWEVETKEALARHLASPSLENLVEVADGIGDSIYVLCQLARSLGLPLNSIWDCIQNSNMAKGLRIDGGWLIQKREDGKILKPEGWSPPNIWKLLVDESNKMAREQKKFGAENWIGEK